MTNKELIEKFIEENGLKKFKRETFDFGMNMTVLTDDLGDSMMLCTPLHLTGVVAVSDTKGYQEYFIRGLDITGNVAWIVLPKSKVESR